MDHRLSYLWRTNPALGSEDSSTHDPSRVSLCALALLPHKAVPASLVFHAAFGNYCCLLQGKVRPDLTIVASKLLLFVGEEKTAKAGLAAAYADVKKKFRMACPPRIIRASPSSHS